ncbi:MAG: DNA polymerase III subunit delta', partial [Variovorax sp.]
MSDVEATEEHDSIPGIAAPVASYDLHGHVAAWRQLVEAHRSGRLHHAWLLQGPRGIGKATAAFAFARRLLTVTDDADDEGPASDPDNPVVRQIAGGSHPNLVHITRPA